MHHLSLQSPLSSDIFVRDFYPRLFSNMWNSPRLALIGNPGISKSWFQLSYLHEACFGDLVPEEERPTCIIRHRAPASIELYIPKGPDNTPEVWFLEKNDPAGLIECFDPARTVYLYEPASTKGSYPSLVPCRSLATVSPLAERIQEFTKNGGRRYMPVWTLPELLSVGAYLRNSVCNQQNKFVQEEYTSEKIKRRFDQYGGIFRHVLPQTRDQLKNSAVAQAKALQDLDLRLLSDPGVTIDKDGSKTISHFILQYNVDEDFETVYLDFPSERVKAMYMERVRNLEFAEAIAHAYKCLMANKPDMLAAALEHAAFFMLQEGVAWQKCSGAIDKATFQRNKMIRVLVEKLPTFDDMEPGVLYVHASVNFKAIEAVFKGADGKVYAVQVKSGPRADNKVECRHLLQICDEIALPDDEQLHLLYITPEKHFKGWCKVKPSYVPGTAGELKVMTDEQIESEAARVEAEYARRVTLTILAHSFNPLEITGFQPEK